MSRKADITVLPGFILPWLASEGHWKLVRNGVMVHVHPDSSTFVVRLAPDWRVARRSEYLSTKYAIDGLFDYLMSSCLLEVLMADALQGVQDG